MFQIVSDEQIPKISINIKNKDYDENDLYFHSEIIIENENDDVFILENLESKGFYNQLNPIDCNNYFTEYLNYFFDEKNQIKSINLKKNLIKSLNSRILKTENIELSAKNILKLLSCVISLHQSPPNLDNINIQYREKLDKKDYISIDSIKNEFDQKYQTKIFNVFIQIYYFLDFEYLLNIIYSEKNCSRIFLDCLIKNKLIKINELKKKINEEEINKLQNSLFKVAEDEEEINLLINLSDGIEKSLNVIKTNLVLIVKILDNPNKSFKGLKWNNPNPIDNISNICMLFNDINQSIKSTYFKDYKLLNIENIFDKMVNEYKNQDLEEYLRLKNLINENKNIDKNILDEYYKNIHNKGMLLIKNNEMKVEQIITFISTQDIYYIDDRYVENPNRDPNIFKYIDISSKNENYKKNIQLIVSNKLYNLYKKSTVDMKKEFYGALIDQIEIFNDLNNIFEIFKEDYIKNDYFLLNSINGKALDLFKQIWDEKNHELSYLVINKWIIINDGINLERIAKVLKEQSFTEKYYSYLLKTEGDDMIIKKIQDDIITFFDENDKNKKDSADEKILIDVFKSAPDDDFRIAFLSKMERKILKQSDFESKEENKNLKFFGLFMEIYNGNEKLKNSLKDCKYIIKSLEIKEKIIKDLNDRKVLFHVINELIINEKIFKEKLKIITNNQQEEYFQDLKKSLDICKNRCEQLETVKEYYTQFYKETRKHEIKLIKDKLKYLENKDISYIINKKDYFDENEDNTEKKIKFNFNEALKESENLRYIKSKFFMAIYTKNKDTYKTEDERFKKSIENYRELITNIIEQKEKNLKFFEIKDVNEILDIVYIQNDKLKDEIEFTLQEFKDLKKENYIKNNLLNDLINYSQKDLICKLLEGVLRFINVFTEIKQIKQTEYSEELKGLLLKVGAEGVSKEEISDTIDILRDKNFEIKIGNEIPLIKFYKFVKKDAILFLKTLIDSKLEIRNLNEFVIENTASELQTSDIDNLIYLIEFFGKIFNDKLITTDKLLTIFFGTNLNDNPDIWGRYESYQKIYGEIRRVYQLYNIDEAIMMTIEKIKSINANSIVDIYKENSSNIITFKIEFIDKRNEKQTINVEGLEEFRNKILLSSNNYKALKIDKEEDIKEKKDTSNKFISLLDNIKLLTGTMNSLLLSGYPYTIDLKLEVKDSLVKDIDDKELKDIIEEYKKLNNNFKKSIRDAYEKYPLLRLFQGVQFSQLFKQIKNLEINNTFHLINSISLNRINNINIEYKYQDKINELENINQYLEKLFAINKLSFSQLFERNKVLGEKNISPGLYRRVKQGDNNNMYNSILNIYLNLTNNAPIINTLLICNDFTSFEDVECFLYRAIFCDEPILFVISNIECLELSIIKNIINIFKKLYKEKKNGEIKSYIIFLYEKVHSGFARFLEKLIPEKNNLDKSYLEQPNNKYKEFEGINLYSSEFSGYGKTTEIKYKVKEEKGNYYYLPIGGTLTREYLIENLNNLNINMKNGNKNYLHLDLSETDYGDLFIEILFKLVILRYINTKRNIYYLGYDINIMIEIPNGPYKFDEKYKILKIFNHIHLEKLPPLRLEENAKFIKDSPIAIVGEVLELYYKEHIETKNIKLDALIAKKVEEYEKIITKYFKVENQNYYQKMNFIKILSVQFKKFTNCFFLYFSDDNNNNDDIDQELFSRFRPLIISNFIALTIIFTKSPFDSILLGKIKNDYIFGNINENEAKEKEIMNMADDSNKQEIFSFERIKPSLFFFNRDGFSFSVIANEEKIQDSFMLKILWNFGEGNLVGKNFDEIVDIANHDKIKIKDLIDYKSLSHEQFLVQIKRIFCLDKLSIEDLKKICVDCGNYIFVTDNFIKMVRILLNIEAKIPVILMGETGVGKTKLLEMLSTLYGKYENGAHIWKKLQIHAGTTDQEIIKFIEDLNKKYGDLGKKDELVWIFFDEINTCNSLGLITEIMCNHTYLGKKINDNFVFLGACNPYRIKTKKMKENGLEYYNGKHNDKINNLVYTVNPLPHSLLNFIFDFGSLQPEDERKYIRNSIIDILTRFEKEKKIKCNKNDFEKIQEEIINCIIICHEFMRKYYDKSSVSLRELKRFGVFFDYFLKYYKKEFYAEYIEMKNSLNMALYLCYYLRLSDKNFREKLSNELNPFFLGDFIKIPNKEINSITNEMKTEENGGIALNHALRENLFTCFICIDCSIPLIIIGKPGTGKSLSFQILYNSLKGEYSDSDLFKKKGKLYRYYYQGSDTSTSEGIIQVFIKAQEAKQHNKESKDKIITLVFFDEMGLAERSINNPLKIIHFLLEPDKEEESVPFLGISNWKLDAAKVNRALILSITEYCIKDLEETAIAIAEALDKDIATTNHDFFETLAETYYEYLDVMKNGIKDNRDFHGNRDFYNLIKTATKELIKRRDELNTDKKKVLTEVGLQTLDRNFGGLKDSNKKIKEIFKEKFSPNYEHLVDYENNPISILDIIKKNISDSNNRYLMLISEGSDGMDISKYLFKSEKRGYLEIIGSRYKSDLRSRRYTEEILNKIKYIMETDNILILKDLDLVYPSLYDLFNQNFILMGDKKFARIAYENAKISSEVNKDFHIIVLIEQNQIKNLKLDPPFLNRFEKHIINFDLILDKRDIEIAKKINNYLELISSFNNNGNLTIDLDNLLINCRLHNIEGLIFKIKNSNEVKYDWINKEGIEYEMNLIKEVFKIIVPTFCQDIIASMANSGINQKDYNDMVIDIYKKSNHPNFISFFKSIKKRKNIIYTFSKITDDFLEGEKELKNVFGAFNEENITIEFIESIKSEKGLKTIFDGFLKSDNKLLILKLGENDLNKISSINYIINNFEENMEFNKKLIILMIHKERLIKKKNNNKEEIELISFFNDDYYQIFIDNLNGKEKHNIFNILQKGNDFVAEQYIYKKDFIKNNLFLIINYLNYNIIFENEEVNSNNYTSKVYKLITENEFLQEQLINYLKIQGKNIKNSIKDIFISTSLEVNDIDFIEVILTKLSESYQKIFLQIIYACLNDNILNPFIINKDINDLLKDIKFKNLITGYFENSTNTKALKMKLNANNITIYNGLKLPKSFQNFNYLINNFMEISEQFNKNEESLRKNYKDEIRAQEKEKKYKENLKKYKDRFIQIMKDDFFESIYNLKKQETLIDDYLLYFIVKNIKKKDIQYNQYIKLLKFLKLLIKIKLDSSKDENNSEESENDFITIFLFTQGYNNFIKEIFARYLDVIKYCENFQDIVEKYLEENKIKYEESKRKKNYSEIVNICLFKIIESFLRAILIYSMELIKSDKVKFIEYFRIFPLIETSFQKINKKYNLSSKEIYSLRYIIKIEESYKNNRELFEKNYTRIIDNLLLQTNFFYCQNYDKLYESTIELIKIFDNDFSVKNDSYSYLLFFILRQEYKNIHDEKNKNSLLEEFFKNKFLLRYSKIFLVEKLKIFKPELNDNENNRRTNSNLINDFMNIDNQKFEKIQNIINILNSIDSQIFNEILLYFFEGLCQTYFLSILKKYKNIYNENCCSEMLTGLSLDYLQKGIQYLYENKNSRNNNLFKIYSIAYLKSYCHFYVFIHKNYFEKVNFTDINRILYEKDENNKEIINMRIIYVLRLYYSSFKDFDEFLKYDFQKEKINILMEISEKIKNESITEGYIFNESFITPKIYDVYIDLIKKTENNNFDFDLIKNNLDAFYCCLVNKTLSFQLGNNKDEILKRMDKIFRKTNIGLKFGYPRKLIYQYLLVNELFKTEIENKIPEKPLTPNDLEILLYSLRFVFNINENENNFYYNLLKENSSTSEFIKNNYIPGSFRITNEFINSYKILKDKLKVKPEPAVGFYICKDCGFLYEIDDCTFPMATFPCINGHTIGGTDHVCFKKDLRVFYDKNEYDYLKEKWMCCPESSEWLGSFESFMNLEEYKTKYIDKIENIIEQKGIIKNYDNKQFENLYLVRDINIITFRLLNFILYSCLFVSYILKKLSEDEMKDYIIKGYTQNLFSVIKKNWELLEISLKEIGIDKVQIFLNMIFDKIMDMINNLESVDTLEKLYAFEDKVNQYIMDNISKKENVEKLNKDYNLLNKQLNNLSKENMKEIIKSSFNPLEYDQKEYPDIQYYSVSSLQNYEAFVNKFNSSEKNKEKYFLINLLVNKDQEIAKNALYLKNIENLNKLGNILIDKYSFRITREEAKNIKLYEKINEINSYYQIISGSKLLDDDFRKTFIEPFIESWNIIKNEAIQYGCMPLRNVKEEKKPINLSINDTLSYFLVDAGEQDGGIYLASAYEHLIEWQNKIIDLIIEKNKNNGILNSYTAQLEDEIEIQDATDNEIIKIDENTDEYLEELIMNYSMRDIFTKDGTIDYSNYYENIYNYDYIEIELAKKILQGKKRFKAGKIKFVVYKFEEFRGANSSILIKFNEKYPKKELSDEEKKLLNEFLKNKNSNFYNDISSSLQIIMNQIVVDICEPDKLIYDSIKKLPNYIIINEKLKDFLRRQYEYENKVFSNSTLVSMFEYFENLCWKDMKNRIPEDFKLNINKNDKEVILDYFEKTEKSDKFIINKKNFTTALRRLISRFLISSRQEVEMDSNSKLSLYIVREEFWNKDIIKKDNFNKEILDICKDNIIVGNSFNLYEVLDGDKYLNIELGLINEEEDLKEDKNISGDKSDDSNSSEENGDSDGD